MLNEWPGVAVQGWLAGLGWMAGLAGHQHCCYQYHYTITII